jgi:1-aminocyclopropane-1-carboxylate synthase
MALSRRGQHFVEEAGGQLIWTVIKDLWHPESNPNGYVSLGVAENSLMHEELSKYIYRNYEQEIIFIARSIVCL